RCHGRPLPRPRTGPRTRHRTARCRRARRLRRLAAAPARPRHQVPGRRPEVRHRVRRARARARGEARGDRGDRTGAVRDRVDLAGWSAGYETPVTYDWNGWTVCKAGPWSQGPALLQQLALLPPELPAHGSAEYVHLLIEGCKLAMADREAWYGDAAEVPLAEL